MSEAPRVLVMMTSTMTNEPRVRREAWSLHRLGVDVVALGTCADGTEARSQPAADMHIRRIDLWDVRAVRWVKRRRAGRAAAGEPAVPAASTGPAVAAPASDATPTATRDVVGDVRNLVHWLAAALQFGWHASRVQTDVYHPHDLPPVVPALVLGRLRGRPVVYESHEYWASKFPDQPISRWVGGRIERAACRRAAAVFVVNDTIADRMVADFGIDRPTVVPNVPMVATVDAVHRRADADPIEVLYHGIVVPGRGVEVLVDAVAQMRADARLVVRGPGELRPWVLARAAELGISDRVDVADPVPLDRLVETASSSDIGVLPFEAKLGYEVSLPNKLFEYMAAGLAIVASDMPELRRVVTSVDNGIVVEPSSVASLAAALDRLAGDRALLDAQRERSLSAAQRLYTWDVQQQSLVDAYRPLLRTGSAEVGDSARSGASGASGASS